MLRMHVEHSQIGTKQNCSVSVQVRSLWTWSHPGHRLASRGARVGVPQGCPLGMRLALLSLDRLGGSKIVSVDCCLSSGACNSLGVERRDVLGFALSFHRSIEVARFRELVEAGHFTELPFYRGVAGFLVQFGTPAGTVEAASLYVWITDETGLGGFFQIQLPIKASFAHAGW